ncbi:MAG: transposase [Comamonadaceae bacterium]|nr:transposase [Comamonadaceae bacterium]
MLQTIPGIDEIAAALILIEIGDDMARFGCARAAGLLGRAEPRQRRERGQAQVGPHAPRQQRHPLHPVRMRQRRAHDQEHPGGQVPKPDGAQVAQEGDRGGGAQDDPADLSCCSAAASPTSTRPSTTPP